MDRDLALILVGGALAGFFTLAGAGLTHVLTDRTERKRSHREYIRNALEPARKYANVMEMDVRNIVWILAGMNIGLPQADRKLLKQNMGSIRRFMIDNTWLPEVADKDVLKAWERVTEDFSQLHLVFAEHAEGVSSRKPVQSLTPAQIKELRDILRSDNPDGIRRWVAPDFGTQEIFASLMSLLASVRSFREKIESLATR